VRATHRTAPTTATATGSTNTPHGTEREQS
jgi:hypothetical protein